MSPERIDTGLLFCSSNSSNFPIPTVVDYSGKVIPEITIGCKGRGEGELSSPLGVAVDRTADYIYVADRSNNSEGFLQKTSFFFQFGSDKMRHPLYIYIDKGKVYVSQNKTGRTLVNNLDGNSIKKLRSSGTDFGDFVNPHGIAIHPSSGDIYVCDCGNDRIQLFSNSKFSAEFGFEVIEYPVDIKLTENAIFVLLGCQNPCRCFYYSLNVVENYAIVSISNYVDSPRSLVIDGAGNFIISDYLSNRVFIFNQHGNLIHTLSKYTRKPRGICLDSKGKIILCSDNNIHIF